MIADQAALDSFLDSRLSNSWLFVKRASQRVKCVYVPDARTLAMIASSSAILPSPYGGGAPLGHPAPSHAQVLATPSSGFAALSAPVQFLSPPFGPFLLSAATASVATTSSSNTGAGDANYSASRADGGGMHGTISKGSVLNNSAPSAAVNNAAAATAAHAASPFVVGKVDVAFPVTLDGLVAALRTASSREETPIVKYVDKDNDMVGTCWNS
eukprot:Opistho-2@85263